MKRVWLLTRFFLALACAFTVAEGQDFSRALDESDPAFAKRVLRISKDADLHTMSSTWNGLSTLFVDYETIGEYPERLLVALQHQPAGEYREIQVTVGEQEGGTPDIAALGFANAHQDPAKDLIVILAWPQVHFDFEGTLYEVRIFEAPQPGQRAPTLLKVSQKFGFGFDGQLRNGTSKHYRFKTIVAVRTELRRLGYGQRYSRER